MLDNNFIQFYEALNKISEELNLTEATNSNEYGRWKKAFVNLIYGKVWYNKDEKAVLQFPLLNASEDANVDLDNLYLNQNVKNIVQIIKNCISEINDTIAGIEEAIQTLEQRRVDPGHIRVDLENELRKRDELEDFLVKAQNATEEERGKIASDLIAKGYIQTVERRIHNTLGEYRVLPCVLHHINGQHSDNIDIVTTTLENKEKVTLAVTPNSSSTTENALGNYVLIAGASAEDANNAHLILHALAIMKKLSLKTNDKGFDELIDLMLQNIAIGARFYYISNDLKIKNVNFFQFITATDVYGNTETPLQRLAMEGGFTIYDDGKAETTTVGE